MHAHTKERVQYAPERIERSWRLKRPLHGLVDAVELVPFRREELSVPKDEERASAISDDNAEMAERVRSELDEAARTASGVYALHGDCNAGFEVAH